tara:strand:- start:781 stop:1332 length:552 start_codon:yes stop_codon:yes gene_type:complete
MTPLEMEQRRQLLRDQTSFFNMPNLMNLFGGNQVQTQQMEIRPEVLEMAQRQQELNPPPGMIFGMGPSFSQAYNQANDIPTGVVGMDQDAIQRAIGSIYNLTGDEAGTLKNTSATEPSFMDTINNLSADEIRQGLQGMQGLLDAVTPPQQELTPARVYSASPGLSLNINPFEELYKRQGILRG